MTYKSSTAHKFVVSLPDGMLDKIAEAATTNERSMNAEIIGRLSRTFHEDNKRQILIDSLHHLNRQLTQAYEEIERLRAELAKAGDMSSKVEIDWSQAPEGATHYQPHQGAYYKYSPSHRCWLIWSSDRPMGEPRWHKASGTDEKQLIARPAAWDGTGLPPVGTVCIVKPHNTLWGFSSTAGHERTVLAYHGEFVWLGQGNMALETTRIDKVDFLPLRTPEQIAIGDRVKMVNGDYQNTGEVRSVFTKANGETRLVVEYNAEGGGSFLHICDTYNLEKIA